jgi:hypothetical protein
VRVAVWTAQGQFPPAGSEVAVAAVDEGLLDMMGRCGYGVQSATAQMEVVGSAIMG